MLVVGHLDRQYKKNWRHAGGYGGNAWAEITKRVISLSRALRKNDLDEIEDLMQFLNIARHNNGKLSDKLAGLEAGPDR